MGNTASVIHFSFDAVFSFALAALSTLFVGQITIEADFGAGDSTVYPAFICRLGEREKNTFVFTNVLVNLSFNAKLAFKTPNAT